MTQLSRHPGIGKPNRAAGGCSGPHGYPQPEFDSLRDEVLAVPSPGLIAQMQATYPTRPCRHCGQSIGAGRLALQPAAEQCAWCASASLHPTDRLRA